jgi:hypothetical protein
MRPIETKHVVVTFAFLTSTAFFLWQHTTGVGWDFAAYSLNARYWFQGGTYFQALRPPLAPLLIGLFGLVSRAWAEFLFIAAVCAPRPGPCAPARPYVYRYLDLKKESMLKKGRRDFPDTLLKLIFYKDKTEQGNTAVW